MLARIIPKLHRRVEQRRSANFRRFRHSRLLRRILINVGIILNPILIWDCLGWRLSIKTKGTKISTIS